MTPARTIDVSMLETYALDHRAPLWWGQILMMVIEGTLFVLLISSYFYVRMGFDVWPPNDIDPVGMLLPTIGLIILLVSVPPMVWAGRGADRKRRPWVVWGTLINLACVVIFLLIRWYELVKLPFKWSTDIYGTFVWCMLGLHTMHAIADGTQTLVILAIVLLRRVNEKQLLGIKMDGLYWYFVVGSYVPVYLVVYVYPAVLKGWRW